MFDAGTNAQVTSGKAGTVGLSPAMLAFKNLPMQDAGDLSQYSKLRDGCRETTESFVREHAGWMLNVARRFFGNDPVAEDVVQDAFTQALKNIKQFEGRSALKT
ncbi:MAG: hypothetical protein OER56_10565, partial [Hyphomicrobiales bacterium]|nr:hypothetical protein [Hyphomicrobiales bacterium]